MFSLMILFVLLMLIVCCVAGCFAGLVVTLWLEFSSGFIAITGVCLLMRLLL